MQPGGGPAGRFTAREVLELLAELPDESAFIAAIRASSPPDAVESEAVTALRARRAWRGWTPDRIALFDIRDGLIGKPSPRPWDDGVGRVAGRRVIDLDEFPNF
jgi:hypothetical protein